MLYFCELMRVTSGIQYLKLFLLGPLMAVVSVFSFHLTMTGETVDSLYHIYLKADKAQKVEIVNELSRVLYDREITDTLYQVTKTTSTNFVGAMMHYLMSEHYYDQEQYESAMEEGMQARELTKSHKADKFQSDMLGALSNAQYRMSDYNEALKTLLQAYEVDKKLDNKALISSDLNSLAAIYLAVGQPVQGINYIEKAIAIEREMDRRDRLATRLGLASELYLLNNEPDKAMDAIKEAYTIDKQDGNTEKAAVRLVQKGAILDAMSRPNEAHNTIMQALPELEKASNTYSLAIAHNQLGSIDFKSGRRDAAIDHYKKALKYSIRCGSPKVERTAERGLWETMRETNPGVALIHLERYTILTDSMHNEMKSIQKEVMETTAYNVEQNVVDKKNQRFSSLLKWGGFVLCLMLAAMAAALFLSWRRNRKSLEIQRQTEEKRAHFFTNITNKLQTPLTVVMNGGQQLIDMPKGDAEGNKKIGEMIVRNGKSMLDLVNQLLDIEKTRDTASQPETKNGDIVMFVRLLVDNHLSATHQKLINLEFSCPVNSLVVIFTPDYIRKIVHGLIFNSLQYTPRNGSIRVLLEPLDNDKMRLTVSDTSKGIHIEDKERIFEPFTQATNDDGVETAMNLSLIQQLVQTMNGSITFDSEVGKGTTFTIEFPVQTDKSRDEKEGEVSSRFPEDRVRSANSNNHKPLAFIVENNEDVAFFIANLLRHDFNLRFAIDGQEALNNAQEMLPDLIITNIMMPVMDDKELMRKIRDNSLLNHIPIIALTADTSEQERLDCIKAGADIVLVKPFNSSELRLMADHLITRCALVHERAVKNDHTLAEAPADNMSKEDKNFINRLIGVIHAQMKKDDINIDHIAAALSLSRKQLRSRVMDMTGLTPVAFVQQVKLNYARRMIANEDTSLTVIAKRCGFQNLSHFSKVFKQQFGVSPLQYRKTGNDFSHPN